MPMIRRVLPMNSAVSVSGGVEGGGGRRPGVAGRRAAVFQRGDGAALGEFGRENRRGRRPAESRARELVDRFGGARALIRRLIRRFLPMHSASVFVCTWRFLSQAEQQLMEICIGTPQRLGVKVTQWERTDRGLIFVIQCSLDDAVCPPPGDFSPLIRRILTTNSAI